MCQVCRHTHCLSVCPNAPDPPAVTTCARCGESVTPGYEYARIDGLDYCAECIEDMPYCELATCSYESEPENVPSAFSETVTRSSRPPSSNTTSTWVGIAPRFIRYGLT